MPYLVSNVQQQVGPSLMLSLTSLHSPSEGPGTYCRLCLSRCGLRQIFSMQASDKNVWTSNNSSELVEKIYECTNIQVAYMFLFDALRWSSPRFSLSPCCCVSLTNHRVRCTSLSALLRGGCGMCHLRPLFAGGAGFLPLSCAQQQGE